MTMIVFASAADGAAAAANVTASMMDAIRRARHAC
jgi:hypothetical protein